MPEDKIGLSEIYGIPNSNIIIFPIQMAIREEYPVTVGDKYFPTAYHLPRVSSMRCGSMAKAGAKKITEKPWGKAFQKIISKHVDVYPQIGGVSSGNLIVCDGKP